MVNTFRGEYISGRIFFKGEYFSGVIFLGWKCSRVNIWVSYSFLGLVDLLQLAHMSSFNIGRLSHPDQVLYRTRRLVAQMMDVLHGSSQASGQDPWPFNNPRISLDTNVYVFKCAKISKIKVHIFWLIRCLACTITKPGQTRRETDGRRDTSPISVLNSIWSVFNATRDQWLHKLKGICWNFEANYSAKNVDEITQEEQPCF